MKQVTLDLSDTYKSFVRQFFPDAKMIADKFHVLRLLNPAINRYRKEITGDKRTHPIRKLLLRSGKKLEYFERRALHEWLEDYPELKEIYFLKKQCSRSIELIAQKMLVVRSCGSLIEWLYQRLRK